MRFAARALERRGVPRERDLRLDGAQHEVRASATAATASSAGSFVCKDGPVYPLRPASRRCFCVREL